MSKKQVHFDAAAAMRMQGATLEQIEAVTGVSKNSLSKWFKDEGVDALRCMLASHPLQQVEKLDRKIEAVIDSMCDAESMPKGAADDLSKLMKARESLAGPGRDDYLRYVAMVTGDLARFAGQYFTDDTDRKKLAGLLNAFYRKINKTEV